MPRTDKTRGRARRMTAAMVGTVVGLSTAVVPALPALAQVPAARDIAVFACPPDEVPVFGFGDVTSANVHDAAIQCVAWYEVTTGTTPVTYGPRDPVTRAQMASFIARVIDYVAVRTPSDSDGLPAASTANAFPCDVSAGAHFASIQRLEAAGVVRGTNDNAEGEACFEPNRPVSRAQMATFLVAAQRVLGQDVAASDADYFTDDNGDTHEANIDAITAAGIAQGAGTDGEGGDAYDPDAPVSRDQMASFLARTLDRLVDRTVAEPPPTATLAPATAMVVGGADYDGTITASGGNIEGASISGCTISPPRLFTIQNPAGAATLAFSVTIPAALSGTSCRLDVVTTFVDGGRDTSSAILDVRAS